MSVNRRIRDHHLIRPIGVLVVSISLSACLKIPDLRETSEAPERDASLTDLDPNPDQTAVDGMILDALMSCDSSRDEYDGACLDMTTSDAFVECGIGEVSCQDVSVDAGDRSVSDEDMYVDPHAFTNTSWIRMRGSAFLSTEMNRTIPAFNRMSNGAGDVDAWTISLYVKSGESGAPRQPIIYYGTSSIEEHHFALYWSGTRDRSLIFTYGTRSNYLRFETPENSLRAQSKWHHLLVTYNGGRTGTQNDELGDAYSRFRVFIDGAQQELTTSESNLGVDVGLRGDLFRIGQHPVDDYDISGFKIDELAIWDSDQFLNVSEIYHEGVARDLSSLTPPPEHWWRMGDGDTYPVLNDVIGGVGLIMNQLSEMNIVRETR